MSAVRTAVRYDVVIIGAGAAGLAAARALTGAGKRICLIDARPRVGGRIFTLHRPDLPLPIELGAEFIHGANASTFAIVDAAALLTAQLPDDHWWVVQGQRERVNFWPELEKVLSGIGALKHDMPFAEYLRRRRGLAPRLRDLALNYAEGYHAAHADRISARVLQLADSEQEGEAPRQFRIAGGQDSVVEWLRAGLDPHRTTLLLGTVAQRVEWSPGSVVVHCGKERIRARSLVFTVPVGVWKSGAVEFDPPLPEKDRALARLEAGQVVKIAFHFRERFWGSVSFLHTFDRFITTWWSEAPFRTPVLTAWAGGHAADALLAEGPEAMLDRVMDSMSEAWGVSRARLDSLLVETFRHDWQADPYSRGAYSYAAVGGANAHAALGRPVEKTLFFAGEATSGDQTGTVAGAIDSGARVAREILRG